MKRLLRALSLAFKSFRLYSLCDYLRDHLDDLIDLI